MIKYHEKDDWTSTNFIVYEDELYEIDI